MKKAFTMIELVFVIVILGILAAVALPKFLGVASQAHEANLKAFVGTLNRSVGPTLWSTSISEGHYGDINYSALIYNKDNSAEQNLTKYTDIPKEVAILDLKKCNNEVNYTIVGKADKAVAGATYYIACLDGNANQSPNFVLLKPTTSSAVVDLDDMNSTELNASVKTVNFKHNGNDENLTILR
ncbi:conserved hypothetical protein [Lebetimonas natsushimae]|uniref:MSHA pilin protein MshA n=1 Tax=Lebetimonas natsushimae TaxID=1936991 RepID=A0A292YDR6_9BACT|nr:type II secretion system protein [Lebetimonas natsushimae]GAX87400.1 conserved hypothetical protein [Lebetimonas natsushimae]